MLWGKVHQNQKNFHKAANLKKESETLLQDAQKKVEKIEAKELNQ